MGFDYILDEISYENLILYTKVLPSYHSKKDKKDGKDSGKVMTKDEYNNFIKNRGK